MALIWVRCLESVAGEAAWRQPGRWCQVVEPLQVLEAASRVSVARLVCELDQWMESALCEAPNDTLYMAFYGMHCVVLEFGWQGACLLKNTILNRAEILKLK